MRWKVSYGILLEVRTLAYVFDDDFSKIELLGKSFKY